MSRKRAITTAALAAGLAAPLLIAAAAQSEELQKVLVTNFPKVQKIEGGVSIDKPVPLASLASVREVSVAPVGPEDVLHLVSGGTIATDGYGSAVLSLVGQVSGDLRRSGAVGAILVPDEEPIQRVLEERGRIQFPMEVAAAGITAETPYFSSSQPRFPVAFPRYRVLFYNTTDKTVTVTLFAYLTS